MAKKKQTLYIDIQSRSTLSPKRFWVTASISDEHSMLKKEKNQRHLCLQKKKKIKNSLRQPLMWRHFLKKTFHKMYFFFKFYSTICISFFLPRFQLLLLVLFRFPFLNEKGFDLSKKVKAKKKPAAHSLAKYEFLCALRKLKYCFQK